METTRLNLKLLKTHKTALQRYAKNEGEALAVVVRNLLREGLEQRGYLPIQLNGAPTVGVKIASACEGNLQHAKTN